MIRLWSSVNARSATRMPQPVKVIVIKICVSACSALEITRSFGGAWIFVDGYVINSSIASITATTDAFKYDLKKRNQLDSQSIKLHQLGYVLQKQRKDCKNPRGKCKLQTEKEYRIISD